MNKERLSPEFDAQIERLGKIYCKAMLFAARYLSRSWCFLPPARIHDQMLRDITESDKHVILVGPREYAKSRIAMIGMMYDGLHLKRLDQMHICNSHELAESQLSVLIHELENNALIHDVFGLRPGKIQRTDRYELIVGKRHGHRIVFRATGIGGTIRGLHPSRIICDDIESTKDGAMVMAKNYVEVHGTIMGALQRTDDTQMGQLVMTGNYIGPHCTIRKMQDIDAKDNPGRWVSRTLSAWEMGETQDITKMPVGESVWPEFRTTDQLHELRREMNAGQAFAFEMEYLNQLISPADCIWAPEMFSERYSELPPRHTLVGVVGVDPAEKVAESADETGIVTIAKCVEGEKKGYYYVLDACIRKLSQNDLCSEAIKQYISPLGSSMLPFCDWVYLENKQRNNLGALASLLQQRARQDNVSVNLQQVVPQQYGDKRQRALKVVDLARQGRILFPKNPTMDMRKLMDQITMFSGQRDRNVPAVDDGHDAFVWALLMLKDVTRSTQLGQLIELGNKLEPLGVSPL